MKPAAPAPLLPHVLVGQPSANGGAAYTVICRGPAHEHAAALAIFISARELADMPRNRDVADQLALRAEAYHWFARFAPETANSFRVEVVLCPACRIADLTAIASAVGDIAVALGLPSETPPATVVAAARALTGGALDDLSTEDLINVRTGSKLGQREREWAGNFVNPFAVATPSPSPLPDREYDRQVRGVPVPPEPAGDWQCHVCGTMHPADHETAGCSHGLRCRRCTCNKCPRGPT